MQKNDFVWRGVGLQLKAILEIAFSLIFYKNYDLDNNCRKQKESKIEKIVTMIESYKDQ